MPFTFFQPQRLQLNVPEDNLILSGLGFRFVDCVAEP